MDSYIFSGRPLESYLEEFVRLCHLVSWSDPILNRVILTSLDVDLLVLFMFPDTDEYPLEDLVSRILQADGPEFSIGVADGDLSDGRPVAVVSGGIAQNPTETIPHPSTTQLSSKPRRLAGRGFP